MPATDEIISAFVVLWAVIDPIGTIPVFLAATKGHEESDRKKIAKYASFVAFGVLVFFLVLGEVVLRLMGVPLAAFQVSGGLILLLFALDMIFGNSKPENEMQLIRDAKETAVFPLAMPSIAGPGAILAVVLLTDNTSYNTINQLTIALVIVVILFFAFLAMRFANTINKWIGNSGAIVVSKIMGLILASMAATNILVGIKEFFEI